MLTLTVQFTVLVVQEMCHQLCVLLCSCANATVALIELRGNLALVRSDASARQHDWKCRICVKQRKSCLTPLKKCVRANLRMLKTMAHASSMEISSLKRHVSFLTCFH